MPAVVVRRRPLPNAIIDLGRGGCECHVDHHDLRTRLKRTLQLSEVTYVVLPLEIDMRNDVK